MPAAPPAQSAAFSPHTAPPSTKEQRGGLGGGLTETEWGGECKTEPPPIGGMAKRPLAVFIILPPPPAHQLGG